MPKKIHTLGESSPASVFTLCGYSVYVTNFVRRKDTGLRELVEETGNKLVGRSYSICGTVIFPHSGHSGHRSNAVHL